MKIENEEIVINLPMKFADIEIFRLGLFANHPHITYNQESAIYKLGLDEKTKMVKGTEYLEMMQTLYKIIKDCIISLAVNPCLVEYHIKLGVKVIGKDEYNQYNIEELLNMGDPYPKTGQLPGIDFIDSFVIIFDV